jgi:hypothetical protein
MDNGEKDATDDIWDRQEKELILQNEVYEIVKHLYEKDRGKWIVFAANQCVGIFDEFRMATKAGQEATLHFEKPAALVLRIGFEEESPSS